MRRALTGFDERQNRKGCWLKDGGKRVSEGMDGWMGDEVVMCLMSICGWMDAMY